MDTTFHTSMNTPPSDDATWIDRIQAEWQEIEREYAAQMACRDQERAALLAKAVEDGMTQQEIATELGISRPYIRRMLRYHRFCLAMHAGRTS